MTLVAKGRNQQVSSHSRISRTCSRWITTISCRTCRIRIRCNNNRSLRVDSSPTSSTHSNSNISSTIRWVRCKEDLGREAWEAQPLACNSNSSNHSGRPSSVRKLRCQTSSRIITWWTISSSSRWTKALVAWTQVCQCNRISNNSHLIWIWGSQLSLTTQGLETFNKHSQTNNSNTTTG